MQDETLDFCELMQIEALLKLNVRSDKKLLKVVSNNSLKEAMQDKINTTEAILSKIIKMQEIQIKKGCIQ